MEKKVPSKPLKNKSLFYCVMSSLKSQFFGASCCPPHELSHFFLLFFHGGDPTMVQKAAIFKRTLQNNFFFFLRGFEGTPFSIKCGAISIKCGAVRPLFHRSWLYFHHDRLLPGSLERLTGVSRDAGFEGRRSLETPGRFGAHGSFEGRRSLETPGRFRGT